MDKRTELYRALMDAICTLPDHSTGLTPEHVELLRALSKPKTTVLLAFAPRCGGAFLRQAVGSVLELAGGRRPKLLRGAFLGADQSQDLYLPELVLHGFLPDAPLALLHNHYAATLGNLELCRAYGLRPVVMRRPIADLLLALHEQWCARGEVQNHGTFHVEPGTYFALEPGAQRDFLVYNVAPWYVKFFASWMLAAREASSPDVHFLEFEDFLADPTAAVARVLAVNGLSVSDEHLTAGVEVAMRTDSAASLANEATGRGLEFFEPDQLEHLARLTSSYRTLDFAGAGLVPAALGAPR